MRKCEYCIFHHIPPAFHPYGVGKWNTCLRSGGKVGRIHLCRVAGNTVWSHVACDNCNSAMTVTLRDICDFNPFLTNMTVWLVLCEYSKFRIKSNSYFSIRFDSKQAQLFEIFEYLPSPISYLFNRMMPIFHLSNQQNLLLTMVQVLYLLEVFILAHYSPPSTETPTTTIVRCHKNSRIYLTSTYYWWLLRPTITTRFDLKFQIIAQLFDSTRNENNTIRTALGLKEVINKPRMETRCPSAFQPALALKPYQKHLIKLFHSHTQVLFVFLTFFKSTNVTTF